MRTVSLVALALLLCGCRHETPASQSPPAAAPEPSAISDLAAPITAPMVVRERLLHDLDQQKQLARERAGTMDEVVNRDR